VLERRVGRQEFLVSTRYVNGKWAMPEEGPPSARGALPRGVFNGRVSVSPDLNFGCGGLALERGEEGELCWRGGGGRQEF
jgi:hypothetical protein